jgi:predicted RecA/RadA family phage recombinase
MQNYVHKGETLTFTAPGNVSGGSGFQVGAICAIAAYTALSGASVEGEVCGVFDLTKDTSTFTDGASVYWDNVNLVCTSNVSTTTGLNLLIGTADIIQASGTNALGGASGDATVRVRLNAKFGSDPRLFMAHAQYNFASDGGAEALITPAVNSTIPINAVIVGSVVNSTTAVTSAGSATLAVGTSAGSLANSLLTATAKASLGTNALVAGAAQFATPVKMSAAGQITVTPAVAALTAGVVEIYVFYYVSNT